MKSLLLLPVLFIFSESVKLPSNFIKCNRKDPDWKKCVFEAAVHATPQFTRPFKELNIPSIEPLLVPEVTISAGSNAFRLTQNYKNCMIYGLTKVEASAFGFDFDKKTIHLEGIFPELRLIGTYTFDGKILLLPVVGEGPGEVTFKNVKSNMTLFYEEYKKKEKTHIKVVSATLKLTPSLIHFKYENLFNGDKRLGDNINQVMNENWEALYEDIEESFNQVVIKIFTSLVNSVFSKLSIEEAFD